MQLLGSLSMWVLLSILVCVGLVLILRILILQMNTFATTRMMTFSDLVFYGLVIHGFLLRLAICGVLCAGVSSSLRASLGAGVMPTELIASTVCFDGARTFLRLGLGTTVSTDIGLGGDSGEAPQGWYT